MKTRVTAARFIAPRLGLVALCLGALVHLSECGGTRTNSGERARQLLVGSWLLTSAGDKPPLAIGIHKHVITFGAKGDWKFESATSGLTLKLSGGGTWSVKRSNRIAYTAGDNRGETTFLVQSGELTFGIDPVLVQPGSTRGLGTVYRRIPP